MTVVCVDDHSILLSGLAESVKQILPDANVNAFVGANDALAFVKKNGCDILICEIDLYDMSGITLARQVSKLNSKVNIIFHTVCDEREHAREVIKIKPSGYLVKPATREQLESELKNLRYSVL